MQMTKRVVNKLRNRESGHRNVAIVRGNTCFVNPVSLFRPVKTNRQQTTEPLQNRGPALLRVEPILKNNLSGSHINDPLTLFPIQTRRT